MDDAVRRRAELAEKAMAEQNERWKSRLLEIARKKFRTTFIGGISAFEESFGFLWGHGEKTPRTAEQEKWHRLWQKCRARALDNGNAQLRAMEKELTLHEIHYEGYRLNLQVVNQKEEDGTR